MNELARAASFFARDLASWKRALVCFVSSSVLSTFAAAEQDSRGSILHETWEQTYPVSENLTLSVQNTDGRIYIYGSDDNQLTVTAVKRSFTQERMDVISIQVAVEGNAAGDGDTATVRTIIPPPPNGGITQDRSGTVDYTILVPQNCTVAAADLTNGEVLIEGLRGPSINARAENGRVLVRNCFTQAQVSLGRGGMDVFYTWWAEWPFSLQAEVRDGDLRVRLPADASVRLNARTDTGHITNHFGEGETDEDQRSVSLTLGQGGESELTLRTGSGNIRIDQSY